MCEKVTPHPPPCPSLVKNENPSTTVFLSDYRDFAKLLNDPCQIIEDVVPLGIKCEKLMVTYKQVAGMEKCDPTGRRAPFIPRA